MDENFRENGDGLFAGAKQYKFMRALFGLLVSGGIGVVVTLFTKPEPKEKQAGLVWGTVKDAIRHYKGSEGSESDSAETLAMPVKADVEAPVEGEGSLPVVTLSAAVMEKLRAKVGDPVYITDTRWWLGGLQSMHVVVGAQNESGDDVVALGPETYDIIVTSRRHDKPLKVERLY